MQERFSVSHKGQELGPFSKDEILQKVKANELSALDYVYVDAKSDWVPLVEFLPAAGTLRPPEARPPASGPKDMKEMPKEGLKEVKEPSKPAPSVAQVPLKAPPKPKAAPEAKTGSVTLKDGVGTIELLQYTAGTVKLALLTDDDLNLNVGKPEDLVVKAAPASKLVLKAGGEMQAGQTASVTIEAHDKWGNRDGAFNGTITAKLSNGSEINDVKITSGRATLTFTSTKAETISIKLLDSGKTGLDISASVSVTYVAGPAARLVLVKPEETVAGQPIKVQVKALDQYGNLATTCNESIKLEVSAAVKSLMQAPKEAKAS